MALYVDVILADGPSHYWRLNETSGTVAADLVGSAPGTVSGGVTLGAAGAFTSSGAAATFNGTTGKIITPAVTLPVVATLEAWINGFDGADRPIVDVNTSGPIFHIGANQLRIYDINAPSNNFAISARALSAGWNHVVAVLNGSTVTFYLNGVGEAPIAFGRSAAQTGIATLGHNPTYGIYWLGQLDEVAIYPKALSAAQVTAHYVARTGVAAPTGGPGIYIATVDRTRETRAFSLNWEYALGARGRAEFEIYDDDSTEAAYRPQIDQRVELRHGATVVFRGKILSVTDQPLGEPGVGTVTAITAVDDWAVASLRRVSENYTAGQTLKAVVTSIVTKYLAVYGLTLGAWPPSSPNGPTLPAMTFDGVSVEDAFNQLVGASGGWVYRLLPTGVVEWFGQAHKIEGTVFSAANKNILGALVWEKSRLQHANKVLVRFGTGLVGMAQTYTGNGSQVRFPITWPVANIGHLTYEGAPYPPGVAYAELVAIGPSTTRPWYVDTATSELVRVMGLPIGNGPVTGIPAPGDIIKLFYNVQFPQTATAQNAEATTFPIEAIIERADIFDKAQAQALATAELNRMAGMPRTLTLRTRLPGAEMILPGSSLKVDVPSRTLPLSANPLGWLVTEIRVNIDVDQEPTTTFTLLEATGGPLLLSWLSFWRDIAGAGAGVGIATGSVISPPHSTTQPPPAGQTASSDVSGPASSVDNTLVRFDGISGKLLQGSIVTLNDSGLLSGAVLPQGGLKLQDTNASHVLQINVGSDLTAERSLTVIPGDANRTLTLTGNSSIGGTAYVIGGADVAVADGGTGLGAFAAGDLLVATGPTTLERLPVGLADQILKVAAGLPAWAPAPATGYTPGGPPVAVDDGGTGLETYAAGDLLFASQPATLSRRAIGDPNYVLTSVSGFPAWAPPPMAGEGGLGDVVGPAASVARCIAVFQDTTGKLLNNTPTEVLGTGTIVIPSGGLYAFNSPTNGFAGLMRGLGRLGEPAVAVRLGDNSGEASLVAHELTATTGVLERGRPALMGDWVDVPYSAANFTTNSASVWTVDAGDVITYRYTLIGNTLILAFELGPTSLNVATQALRIALPAGVVASKQTRTLSQMYSAGIVGAATIVTAPAAGYVSCAWYGINFTAANWAASTNNTYVQGQIVVPI